LIPVIMIAAVYGFQALVLIIKRKFRLVGWMVIYILSYPVYGLLLSVNAFWCMDDFSWGNTRLVAVRRSSSDLHGGFGRENRDDTVVETVEAGGTCAEGVSMR